MATSDYCTVTQLKTNLSITDSLDDGQLGAIITAASRGIDQMTARAFYKKPSASTEARYFTAERKGVLWIDDCISISELATDEDGDRTYETVWTVTDYDLEPYNAALRPEPEPYTQISTTPLGNYTFPLGAKGVKITGVWGWSATPALITQATLLQAQRWFKRRDAIFGVMGANEFGQVQIALKLDPDIAQMISYYKRI
jgi:hypothetical protein